jgi:hypothetical protein
VFTDALVLPPAWLSPGGAVSHHFLDSMLRSRLSRHYPLGALPWVRPAVAMVTGLPSTTVNRIL